MSKKMIGLTGPSKFTPDCIGMIENFFNANFIYLNQTKIDNVKEHLAKCDALVLGGGIDIHPSIYGDTMATEWQKHAVLNKNNLTEFDFSRDVKEVGIIHECFKRKIPILGICRGHQLLAAYHKLPIISDLTGGDVVHQPLKVGISAGREEPMHTVKLHNTQEFPFPEAEEREILREAMGEKSPDLIFVNSFHHQGVDFEQHRNYANNGLMVHGTAYVQANKQIIEIMRGISNKWLSVQWHPEYDYDMNSSSRHILEYFRREYLGKNETVS